jgi:hypothetical protein
MHQDLSEIGKENNDPTNNILSYNSLHDVHSPNSQANNKDPGKPFSLQPLHIITPNIYKTNLVLFFLSFPLL